MALIWLGLSSLCDQRRCSRRCSRLILSACANALHSIRQTTLSQPRSVRHECRFEGRWQRGCVGNQAFTTISLVSLTAAQLRAVGGVLVITIDPVLPARGFNDLLETS